jgi:hypothetical protein
VSRGVEWLLFFLGTPRRALTTVVTLVLVGLVHHVWPGALAQLLAAGIAEFWPVLCYLFFFALVIIALQTVLRTPRR